MRGWWEVKKPLAVDLFCGLGGWTRGLQKAGYDVIGYDIEKHEYGKLKYPSTLILQDLRTLHGSVLKDASLIVASPPCQGYSYRAMPWKAAKALPPPSNVLFLTCFRLQWEAMHAAKRFIPLVIENVKGAQPWVGRARAHYGSFYLWGDVPLWLPRIQAVPKVPGFNFHQHENGKPGGSFQSAAIKNTGGSWFGIANNTNSGVGQNPVNGVKAFFPMTQRFGSKSHARKAASALIAHIPPELSLCVANCFLNKLPFYRADIDGIARMDVREEQE